MKIDFCDMGFALYKRQKCLNELRAIQEHDRKFYLKFGLDIMFVPIGPSSDLFCGPKKSNRGNANRGKKNATPHKSDKKGP